MNAPAKLAAYGLGVVMVFVVAVGAGRLAGPLAVDPEPEPAAEPAAQQTQASAAGDAGTDTEREEPAPMPEGLTVANEGYALEVSSPTPRAGQEADLAFRITDAAGEPVTGFTPTHEKELHLIVVRRDLTRFQHVHPTMAADGTWSIPFTFPDAGSYRLFADFQPAERQDAITLGRDVLVPGTVQPEPLPEPASTATTGAYTVSLEGTLTPGATSKLTLSVTRDGEPVTDLQPYLGAFGHLVMLRDGDLAYLHVHPDGEPGDGRTPSGPDVTFYADVPTAGDYRLFLDFQHAGRVHTAAFTATAGTGQTPADTGGQPATGDTGGHGDGGDHGH